MESVYRRVARLIIEVKTVGKGLILGIHRYRVLSRPVVKGRQNYLSTTLALLYFTLLIDQERITGKQRNVLSNLCFQ